MRLHGAGMDEWTDEHWRDIVRAAFATTGAEGAFETVSDTTYSQADITQAGAPTRPALTR